MQCTPQHTSVHNAPNNLYVYAIHPTTYTVSKAFATSCNFIGQSYHKFDKLSGCNRTTKTVAFKM